MRTVWKFPIEITDAQIVSMPARSVVIHAGLDPQGHPCVWARVNTAEKPVERSIHLSGTGTPEPDGDNRHIGSFNHGPFVWHVWEPC